MLLFLFQLLWFIFVSSAKLDEAHSLAPHARPKWSKTVPQLNEIKHKFFFFDSGAKGSTWQYTDVTTLKNMQTDIYIYLYTRDSASVYAV